MCSVENKLLYTSELSCLQNLIGIIQYANVPSQAAFVYAGVESLSHNCTNRVGGNTVLAGLSYIRKSNLDRITVKVSKLPQLTMNEMFLEPTRC